MNILSRHKKASIITAAIAVIFLIFSVAFTQSAISHAGTNQGSGRIITIHDRGQEKVILTHADTIRGALKESGIPVDAKDLVEPSLDEKLVATNYQVNIYRVRPVLIIDGNVREKVITAYQTPEQIASSAKITLYPEDIANVDRVDDLNYGAGLQMTIKRATPFMFTLYGKTSLVRTQGRTVAEMLHEKGIKLTSKDKVTPDPGTKLTSGMEVKVWREGKQTVTTDEEVAFDVSQIQDADREIGYRQVVTPGVKGLRTVTYEIVVVDGKEVSRKEIASLVLKQPVKQVEIVGAKPTFSGSFSAALVQLRACEAGGSYTRNSGNGYYGAYQYDVSTWGGYMGYSRADLAPPAVQDSKVWETYSRRGWSPWPSCGASLPDVYR